MPDTLQSTAPKTRFSWSLYANATFAGLAILIPIPIVDWFVELFFRRRILKAVAKRHGVTLSPEIIAELRRQDMTLVDILLLPFQGVYWLLKRISRTILYFLSIKESTDQLSRYWHQAYLMDYMIAHNQLDTVRSARAARQAMAQVLEDTRTSPLRQLAFQMTHNIRHLWRLVWPFGRRTREAERERQKQTMAKNWANMQGYLESLGGLYQQLYEQQLLEAEQTASDMA